MIDYEKQATKKVNLKNRNNLFKRSPTRNGFEYFLDIKSFLDFINNLNNLLNLVEPMNKM
jgi:hypothetical protein